ncbi:MAG TPA: hypothetical protein VMM58_12965, partial [Bacteroidota bacterium]|nr:hypothetical protein [Bacteroidota bacterium]
MYEQLLKQAERYLGTRSEVFVSVKQLWDVMVKEGKAHNFAVPSLMADFECLLDGDKRFEFVADKNPRSRRDLDFDELAEYDDLEKLGFMNNQKVKLRRIPLPSTEIEEESFDALDRAISMEDLDENFTGSSLLDDDPFSGGRE